MDHWETVLRDYSSSQDFRYYFKALQTANSILKEDLAPFEIEWISETLLYKPINLLEIISLKRTDETWYKIISDAFKVIGDIVTKHWAAVEKHCEDIIACCELSYDAETRKQAIHCLITILKRPEVRLSDVTRHIRALEEATTCKTPLALLVGVICEYHDDQVEAEYERIWRIYINMLGSNSKTQTVIKAVLQGVRGLFAKFGDRLPMLELAIFYTKMTKEFVRMTTCEEVIFGILNHHAKLFKERLAEDKSLRDYIWNLVIQRTDKNAALALKSIYEAIFTVMDNNRIEMIVNTEIVPRTEHRRTLVKYTALRVQSRARARAQRGVSATLSYDADCLEFELGAKAMSYEVAEAVSWCIESNTSNSERLLLAAILFYHNLPANKRKDVVVNGILNAPNDVRKTAVKFLITHSCHQDGATSNIDKFLPLWSELLDSHNEDTFDSSKSVFEHAIAHLLDQFVVCGDFYERPAQLTSLLTMTSHILSITQQDYHTTDACVVLLPAIVKLSERFGVDAPLMSVVRSAIAHMQDSDVSCIHAVIRLDSCLDEATMCETCLALILAPEGIGDKDSMLLAFRIIFSRNDVEPKLLAQALRKFQNLLESERNNLDEKLIHKILNLIERLRSRKDMTGKDSRILHREIVMFLGKYGNNNYIQKYDIDISIVKMKDLLNFSIPGALEGTKSLHINLQRMVEIAIRYEEPKVLQTLLTIVIANWDTLVARASGEQVSLAGRVVARLAHAASRAHASRDFPVAALHRAATLCDATSLVSCISEEISPGPRRMLSDCLEALLLKSPVSTDTETKTETEIVGELVVTMISGDDAASVKAGLDIAQSLITALRDRDKLSVLFLPQILTHTSKIRDTHAQTVFTLASQAYTDKKELFNPDVLENLYKDLVSSDVIKILAKDLVLNNLRGKIQDLKAYKKMLKLNLEFVKETIYDQEHDIREIITNLLLENYTKYNFVNCLHVFAELKSVFDLDLEVSRRILSHQDGVLVRKLFEVEIVDDGTAKWDGVLMFLKEYAVILLECQYQKTLQYIADIIKNMSPNTVIQLNKTFSVCLSTYKTELKKFPPVLTSSFEDWCKIWKIKSINIKGLIYSTNDVPKVQALKIMSKIFHETHLYETKEWTSKLLDLYKMNYFKGLKIKIAAIADVLTISATLLTVADMKQLLNNDTSISFCRDFIDVFCDKLLVKPFVLLEGADNSCTLLLDIVKCCLKTKYRHERFESVFELIDKVWTKFEEHTTFNDKQSLLLDLLSLPTQLKPQVKPLQWAVRVLTSKDSSRHDKIRLIGLLPAGEEFSACYKSYASCLPTRLSEMEGEHIAMFRGLLDALSATGDMTLFGIVVTIAGGDDTKGWWDEALDSCMETLARKGDEGMVTLAYKRCWDGLTLGVCHRVLVPLLRYSTSRFCENFFSTIISELFAMLRRAPRAPSVSKEYHRSVDNYTKAFSVLQVAFEKISQESLGSATSVLHQNLSDKKAWVTTTETCKLCVSLQDKISSPPDATNAIKLSCRLFHCAAYNCLTAAICRKRPDERFYKFIFNDKAWSAIVDQDAVYKLYIQPRWRHRTTHRQTISADGTGGVSFSLTSRTVGTRLFLRTLSENPLQYDMVEDEEQTNVSQEFQLLDSELNTHECASTLSALARHAATLAHAAWRERLVAALAGHLSPNTKWLLAQAICNAEDDLKAHAQFLREPLFQMIVETALVGEKILLNGLHIDVINVLVNWSENPQLSDKTFLNATIDYLISTCIHYMHMQTVYKSVLDTIDRVLKVYGSMVTVSWSVFEKYIHDIPKDATSHLQILQHILRNDIYIPQLLPTLLDKYDPKHWRSSTRLAEIFGLAANICPNTEKEDVLVKFRSILDRIKAMDVGSYVRVLYSAQKWCKESCDERHFKMIADLAQKIEKPKCLAILRSYMEQSSPGDHHLITDAFHTISVCELLCDERGDVTRIAVEIVGNGMRLIDNVLKRRAVLLIAGLCSNSVVELRRAAFGVIMKAFEEILSVSSSSDYPPAKRHKTELTPILKLMEINDTYHKTIVEKVSSAILDRDQKVSEALRIDVEKYLCEDFSTRFAECFYLTIYLPATTNNKLCDQTVCVSALLEMLFSRLRSDDPFRERRFREQDVIGTSTFGDVGSSKLQTLSSTYQGTFRSSSVYRKTAVKVLDSKQSDIDVTMPIIDMLDTFLEFSKTNPDASLALCVQIMKRLRGSTGFDLDPVLSRQLAGILSRSPNSLTPFVLDTMRVFIDNVSSINGFKESIETLRQYTIGSDGFEATKLLHEDVLIRCNETEMFILGIGKEECYDTKMDDERREFALEDLISAFGKLSNWDDLRIQEKRRIQDTGLPLLWTSEDNFKLQLDEYMNMRDGGNALWFDKMAATYCGDGKQDAMSWLREIDEWPRKQFVVSAVTEAIVWQQAGANGTMTCDVTPSECLAEWAARLMLRSAYRLQSDSNPHSPEDHAIVGSECRLRELRWCEEANRRCLPKLALQCVDRNKSELRSDEVLAWSVQSVLALQSIGIQANDAGVLRDALEKAEKSMAMFGHESTIVANLEMERLILQLNYELKSLSKSKINDTLQKNAKYINDALITKEISEALLSILELAMFYYDDLFEQSEDMSQDAIINDMTIVLGHIVQNNLSRNYDLLLSMIFNRLATCNEMLSEATARNLLEQLRQVLPKLDSFSAETLKDILHIFPADIRKEYHAMDTFYQEQEDMDICKKHLELICSASYSLMSYCVQLETALKANDPVAWKKTFDSLKLKIFENPYAGSDYRQLTSYKTRLYHLYNYDNSPATAEALSKIIEELFSKEKSQDEINQKRNKPSTLRLSQLCVSATGLVERAQSLKKLLAVSDGHVVKLYDEVTVFKDSVRRPCVFSARLSNGRKRRYLVKTGEPLRVDAALQRSAAILPLLCQNAQFRGYNVTPLSEDCALIEYLEDHERLRDLMMGVHNLNDGSSRARDEDLILSPAQSLQSYHHICAVTPRHILRSAVEQHSTCAEDFIARKRTFMETLSAMSIINWLFGVGDRHLQNIMYNIQDGGVCGVDWAAILKYGDGELPPARLTACLLAVCDTTVLESRLQDIMSCLRKSKKFYIAFINMSFRWMGKEFAEKFPYIRDMLEGNTLSYQVTKKALENSKKIHKEKYIQLLEQVFENRTQKHTYSVEEQVSCFLQQCTDPRILSVTRRGWEPWI